MCPLSTRIFPLGYLHEPAKADICKGRTFGFIGYDSLMTLPFFRATAFVHIRILRSGVRLEPPSLIVSAIGGDTPIVP
jgi:hypothetical protein